MQRREFINRSAILGASLVAGGSLVKGAYGMVSDISSRSVIQVLDPHRSMVGSIPIIRAFPGGKRDFISPFLLLDEFGDIYMEPKADPVGVGAHPHAGIVPTSYFVSGSGHHKDSLGYDFQVNKGEFMLFQAGKGAIHMEYSGQKLFDEGGVYHGFQIWLNLPADNKYIDPDTLVMRDKQIPEIKTDKYTIKVVMGSFGEHKAAAETVTPAFYYHVTTKANTQVSFEVDANHNAFIYNIKGELELKDQLTLKEKHLAMYERGKEVIDVFSEEEAEFLLLGGQPLNDPVVSYGPFVMNSEAQINQCIRDYNAGKMGNPNLVK